MNHLVEIKIGFIDSVLFLVMNFSRFLQEILTYILFGIFVKPVFLFSKILDFDGSKITLDCLKVGPRIVWIYLKFVFKILAKVNGFVRKRFMYERLVAWNSKIPLLGYLQGDISYQVDILLDHSLNGRGRVFESSCFSVNKPNGQFIILYKEFDTESKDKQIYITCVWVSGNDAGKVFTIKKFPDLSGDREVPYPSAIYYPPSFVIVLFEVIISLGAILTVIQVAKSFW
jgi:hypothetical protein